MFNAELMTPHDTREAMYHEALETFIRTSAAYMELDIPAATRRVLGRPLMSANCTEPCHGFAARENSR